MIILLPAVAASHLGKGREGVFQAISVRVRPPLYRDFGKSPHATGNGAEWRCGPSAELGIVAQSTAFRVGIARRHPVLLLFYSAKPANPLG